MADAPNVWVRNVIKVSELPPDIHSAAIVSPDGKWHDEFEEIPRWEGLDSDELERVWDETSESILYQHCDCVVVIVDCHR